MFMQSPPARRPFRPSGRAARRLWVLEGLEDRLLLSGVALTDIQVDAVRTADCRSVTVDYDVNNVAAGPFALGIYRAPGPTFDPRTEPVLAFVTVSGANAGTGHHSLTVSVLGGIAPQAGFPYVVAEGDPFSLLAESTKANNTAYFRTYVIGAVVDGYDPTALGSVPPAPSAWVQTMVGSLVAQGGYDVAIPFTWSSGAWDPTQVYRAASTLYGEILADAQAIAGLQPNDVVDIHLIGHSRGTPVVSLVAQALPAAPLSQLDHGYLETTFLDPHPANNAYGLNAAFTTAGALLLGGPYVAFQAAVHDPAIIIPARVNAAEDYFEDTDPSLLTGLEATVNMHGLPPGALQIQDPSQTAFQAFDLTGVDPVTGLGIGHVEVHDWYQNHVIPTLGPGSPYQPGVQPGFPGANATLAAAGAGVAADLYVVGQDHALYRYHAATGWSQVGAPGTVRSVAVAAGPTGLGVAYVVSTGGGLFRYDPVAGWAMLGAPGSVAGATATTDASGRPAGRLRPDDRGHAGGVDGRGRVGFDAPGEPGARPGDGGRGRRPTGHRRRQPRVVRARRPLRLVRAFRTLFCRLGECGD